MITNAPPPYLTDEEIAGICKPLTMGSAQRRYLADNLGLLVKQKPNGRPLVARSEFERVMGAQRFGESASTRHGPNVASIRDRWAKRNEHGTQA